MKELVYLIICAIFVVSSVIAGCAIIDEDDSDKAFTVACAMVIVGAIPSLILGFFLKWNFSTLLYEKIFKTYYVFLGIGAGIVIIIFLANVLFLIEQTALELLKKND